MPYSRNVSGSIKNALDLKNLPFCNLFVYIRNISLFSRFPQFSLNYNSGSVFRYRHWYIEASV